jgi:hypothetical protein
MATPDTISLIATLPWDTIAHILFSVCAAVWLLQQVHTHVHKEITDFIVWVLRVIAWVVTMLALVYTVHTYVDWAHISKKTMRAGVLAFMESAFKTTTNNDPQGNAE